MKLTSAWLKEKGACGEGIRWFENQKETDLLKLCELAISKKDRQLLSWANWAIVRKMKYAQYVSYAIFAAEQVLDIFEKKHPDDKRPRLAIEAAKKCLKDPSKENKKAAYAAYAAADAAYAAYAYADAAYAYAYAAAAYAAAAAAYAAYADAAYAYAYAAAAYAAAAAAYAAYADAAYAAYADAAAAYAAADAADADAAAEMRIKILEYGMKLLRDK